MRQYLKFTLLLFFSLSCIAHTQIGFCRITVWNMGEKDKVLAPITFTPDGRFYARANSVQVTDGKTKNEIHVIDIKTGNRVGVYELDGPHQHLLTFSKDGKYLAIRKLSPMGIVLWEVGTTNTRTVPVGKNQPRSVAFLPDTAEIVYLENGKVFASGFCESCDGTLRIDEAIKKEEPYFRDVHVTGSGSVVAVDDRKGIVVRWSSPRDPNPWSYRTGGEVRGVATSRTTDALAIGIGDVEGKISLVEVHDFTKAPTAAYSLPIDLRYSAMGFSPDGNRVVLVSHNRVDTLPTVSNPNENGKSVVVDRASGATPPVYSTDGRFIAVSIGGRSIVGSAYERGVTVLHAETLEVLAADTDQHHLVPAFEFADGSLYYATAQHSIFRLGPKP